MNELSRFISVLRTRTFPTAGFAFPLPFSPRAVLQETVPSQPAGSSSVSVRITWLGVFSPLYLPTPLAYTS